jgi:hypothetical protein
LQLVVQARNGAGLNQSAVVQAAREQADGVRLDHGALVLLVVVLAILTLLWGLAVDVDAAPGLHFHHNAFQPAAGNLDSIIRGELDFLTRCEDHRAPGRLQERGVRQLQVRPVIRLVAGPLSDRRDQDDVARAGDDRPFYFQLTVAEGAESHPVVRAELDRCGGGSEAGRVHGRILADGDARRIHQDEPAIGGQLAIDLRHSYVTARDTVDRGARGRVLFKVNSQLVGHREAAPVGHRGQGARRVVHRDRLNRAFAAGDDRPRRRSPGDTRRISQLSPSRPFPGTQDRRRDCKRQ